MSKAHVLAAYKLSSNLNHFCTQVFKVIDQAFFG